MQFRELRATTQERGREAIGVDGVLAGRVVGVAFAGHVEVEVAGDEGADGGGDLGGDEGKDLVALPRGPARDEVNANDAHLLVVAREVSSEHAALKERARKTVELPALGCNDGDAACSCDGRV